MSKKMPKIAPDYFKETAIYCNIDDTECDECQNCYECEKAIHYLTYNKEDEYNEMIAELIPSNGRLTKGNFGMINPENTIVRFGSVKEMNKDGIFKKYTFTEFKHGYTLKIPLFYPRFHLLKNALKLGIPEYYLFQNFESPLIAVYPNAVYATAPECDDNNRKYQ